MRSNSLHAAISDLAALRPNWSLLADTLPDEFLRQVKGEIESLSAEVKRMRSEILGAQRVDAEMDGSSVTFHAARAGGYAIVPLSSDGSGLADSLKSIEGGAE